jgi:hypothetical protein
MRLYTLKTEQGHWYHIHANGNIERGDGQNGNGSDSWTLVGLKHTKRNETIRFEDLVTQLPKLAVRFKNGKGQYTMLDYDHGTMRRWSARITELYAI